MAEAVKEEGANDLCREQGPATHGPLQSPRGGRLCAGLRRASALHTGRPGPTPGYLGCAHPEVVRVRTMTDGTAEASGLRASTLGTTSEVTGCQVAPRA